MTSKENTKQVEAQVYLGDDDSSENPSGHILNTDKLTLLVPLRIVELLVVILFHSLIFFLSWSLRKLNLKFSDVFSTGDSFRGLLQALGPTFIQLGQILSSRPDLVSPEISVQLARLQEEVEAKKPRCVKKVIEKHIGQEFLSVFRHFEESPIATGSVAHVYRATMLDGTEVAIKMIRPGVRWRIVCDMAILSAMAKAFGLLPKMKLIPMLSMVNEFSNTLITQLNLSSEADNYASFEDNFRNAPHIRFPRVYRALSNDCLLYTSPSPRDRG